MVGITLFLLQFDMGSPITKDFENKTVAKESLNTIDSYNTQMYRMFNENVRKSESHDHFLLIKIWNWCCYFSLSKTTIKRSCEEIILAPR